MSYYYRQSRTPLARQKFSPLPANTGEHTPLQSQHNFDLSRLMSYLNDILGLPYQRVPREPSAITDFFSRTKKKTKVTPVFMLLLLDVDTYSNTSKTSNNKLLTVPNSCHGDSNSAT